MTDDVRMALAELLRKAEAAPDVDVLREGVRVLAEALMELEVAQHLGAERHERTPERIGQRNGDRERAWDTLVDTVELRAPRVRDGGFFPSLLEPRKRAERPLTAASPDLWLDATFVKVRAHGRVVSQAVVVAVGVTADGICEALGIDIGPSEDGAFWLAFLRGLLARGLAGVRLVTSDAHQGLRAAIGAILHGANGQRCRVHFVRNALALVPKGAQAMVAATIRTAFSHLPPLPARRQWREVADGFRARWPRLAALLDEAEPDVLAYLAFPAAHWRRL